MTGPPKAHWKLTLPQQKALLDAFGMTTGYLPERTTQATAKALARKGLVERSVWGTTWVLTAEGRRLKGRMEEAVYKAKLRAGA